MPANVPSIGVRLSAEGVQDVIKAFGRVRQEGKAAGHDTAEAFAGLEKQLDSVKELLPAITAGFAIERLVEGLVEAGKEALEYADSIGKAGEKTGVSAGHMSALALAAKEADVDVAGLTGGLLKLTKSAQEAGNGSKEAKDAYKTFGVTLQDMKRMDAAQIFGKISENLEKVQDVGTRNTALFHIFGKSYGDLIPVMKQVSEVGFDGLIAKAKRLGVYLSQDAAENAKKAADNLQDLGLVSKGVALQLLSGMLPAVASLLSALAGVANTGGGFKEWGRQIGDAAIDAAEQLELFLGPLRHVKLEIVALFDDLRAVAEMTATASHGKGIGSGFKDLRNSIKAAQDANDALHADKYDSNTFEKNVRDRYAKIRADVKRQQAEEDKAKPADGTTNVLNVKLTGENAEETKKAAEEARKLDKARSDYRQQLAENELSLRKLVDQQNEAEDKRAYDAGLLNLDDYFDKRYGRITKAADDEWEALNAKRDAAEGLRGDTPELKYKKAQELAKIDAQIDQLQLKRTADLRASEDERAKARHDSATKELQDVQKLQQATGDATGAAHTALQLELQDYEALLKRRHDLTDAQRQAMLADYQNKGEAKIDFSRWDKAGAEEIGDMNQKIGVVQDRASSGAITQLEATARILEIEKERLPLLQQIGAELAQDARDSGDGELIARADDFNTKIKALKVSLKDTATAQAYLFQTLETQGMAAGEEFFASWIDGSKSFTDSLTDMGKAFEQMIAQMIAKMLMLYLIESIVGWVTGGNESAIAAVGKNMGLSSHGAGGWTGDGPIDKISGVVHGQEYVVKAGPASRYRGFLEAVNSGLQLNFRQQPTAYQMSSAAVSNAFAGDGALPASGGGTQVIINNNTGQPVDQQRTTTPGGGERIEVTIGRVAVSAVAKDMAAGGATAKTIERNYNLDRGGTRRG